MANEIQAAQTKSVSLIEKFASKYSVDSNKLMTTLKSTCFKGDVSNEQMMALLIVADQYGLNPFTKEIYAFPDKGAIVPVVSVDGWSRIINENPLFNGIEFEYGPTCDNGKHHEWIDAIIHRKDRDVPTKIREFLSEVKKNSGPWNTHCNRMHRHKALIQCARVAFGFAGIFDPDEAANIVGERDITPRQAQRPSTKSASQIARFAAANQASKPAEIEAEVVEHEFLPADDGAPTLSSLLVLIETASTPDDWALIQDLSNSLSSEDQAAVSAEAGKRNPEFGMAF